MSPEREMETNRLRALQRRLLEMRPTSPPKDVPALCEVWRVCLNADWIWLWLHNRSTKRWELVGSSAAGTEQIVPPPPAAIATSSVVEYSLKSNSVVHVTDAVTWSQDHDGQHFEVLLRDFLVKRQSRSFFCVPLQRRHDASPAGGEITDCMDLQGAISIHYKDGTIKSVSDDEMLQTLGNLSLLVLTSSYQAHQRNILIELNRLAAKHLSGVSASRLPFADRKAYLADLARLITEQLHVKCVTIFYRQPFTKGVGCLFTTGLYDEQGLIPQERLSTVTYNSGENRTGEVYETAQPFVAPYGSSAVESTKAKYREIPWSMPQSSESWIIFPIVCKAEESQEGSGDHLGVIRLTGYRSPMLYGLQRSFDPIQIQTVAFVVQQIAPVLLTFETSIQRQNAINVIKHDLYSPLRMIKDSARELLEIVGPEIERTYPKRRFDLGNILIASNLATNLTVQLDPDASQAISYAPIKTLLEAEIIAPLKSMFSNFAEKENNMTIQFMDFREVIPRLFVDPELIERVFLNLLTNAIKYGTSGTRIMVEPRADVRGFYVDVTNWGIGIERSELPHLFTPHYRSERAMRLSMGSGLGLAISRAAMKKHGGDLILTAPERPTVFSMFFPRYLAHKRHQ